MARKPFQMGTALGGALENLSLWKEKCSKVRKLSDWLVMGLEGEILEDQSLKGLEWIHVDTDIGGHEVEITLHLVNVYQRESTTEDTLNNQVD